MKKDTIQHKFTCAGRTYTIWKRKDTYGFSVKGRGMNQPSFPFTLSGLVALEYTQKRARELSPRAKMQIVPLSATYRTLLEGCS